MKNALIFARVKTGLNHSEKGTKYFSRIPEIFYHNGQLLSCQIFWRVLFALKNIRILLTVLKRYQNARVIFGIALSYKRSIINLNQLV